MISKVDHDQQMFVSSERFVISNLKLFKKTDNKNLNKNNVLCSKAGKFLVKLGGPDWGLGLAEARCRAGIFFVNSPTSLKKTAPKNSRQIERSQLGPRLG